MLIQKYFLIILGLGLSLLTFAAKEAHAHCLTGILLFEFQATPPEKEGPITGNTASDDEKDIIPDPSTPTPSSKQPWWEELKAFLGQDEKAFSIFSDLMGAEIAAPHYIIYFPIGQATVRQNYYDAFLRKIKEKSDQTDLIVFLEGRASQTGDPNDPENKRKNKILSGKREKAVLTYLTEICQLDKSKFQKGDYGFGPPQIGPEIRAALSLDKGEVNGNYPNADKLNQLEINQSVLISFLPQDLKNH